MKPTRLKSDCAAINRAIARTVNYAIQKIQQEFDEEAKSLLEFLDFLEAITA
jgi:hypothetical protein